MRSPRCAASRWPTPRRSGSTQRGAIAADYAGPRYCTGFLVAGAFPREQLERELAPLGDSLVVVSDGELVRAHVHTDDPGRALSAATGLGELSGVEISDMYAQRDELAERGPAPRWRSRTTGASPTCSRSSTATATACSTRAWARACC